MNTNYKLLFETLTCLNIEKVSLESAIKIAAQKTKLPVLDSFATIRDYLYREQLIKHNPKLRQPDQKVYIGGGLYQVSEVIHEEFISDNISEKCMKMIKNNELENYLRRKKIFLYVGHSNWGKSFTLKHITENNSNIKVIKIYNQNFRVRKMSNDDDESKLLKFVNSIRVSNYQNYIIAFCPRQNISQNALEILNILRSFSELYFFVQKKQYGKENFIDDIEIQSLNDYGTVFTLEEEFEYNIRAEKFLDFIGKQI